MKKNSGYGDGYASGSGFDDGTGNAYGRGFGIGYGPMIVFRDVFSLAYSNLIENMENTTSFSGKSQKN